jgi:hypothetical protein
MEREMADKALEIVKRSGAFDRTKNELLEKLSESDAMIEAKEQCKELVEDLFNREKGKKDRVSMRDELKRRMRHKNLIGRHMNQLINECSTSNGISPDFLENICRQQLGIPPLNTNTEVVDMELSDGASSPATSIHLNLLLQKGYEKETSPVANSASPTENVNNEEVKEAPRLVSPLSRSASDDSISGTSTSNSNLSHASRSVGTLRAVTVSPASSKISDDDLLHKTEAVTP